MEAYRYIKTVQDDGTVVLEGLPPSQEVEVIVVQPMTYREQMLQFMQEFRATHPFAKMSKEEILEVLRETREAVADELYGD